MRLQLAVSATYSLYNISLNGTRKHSAPFLDLHDVDPTYAFLE